MLLQFLAFLAFQFFVTPQKNGVIKSSLDKLNMNPVLLVNLLSCQLLASAKGVIFCALGYPIILLTFLCD